MKKEYDFSRAVKGRFADSIPRGAVFVKFGPDVSALFDATGSLDERLHLLVSKRRRPKVVQIVALSRDEFASLKPLITRLGGEVINPSKKTTGRKAG